MPYTIEQFRREFNEQFLNELTLEERLEGLPPEQIEAYLRKLRGEQPPSESD